MGFVGSELLGTVNMRPRQFGMGGHIGEELGIGIRKRTDDEPLVFKSRESARRVRPTFKIVPYPRNLDHLVISP